MMADPDAAHSASAGSALSTALSTTLMTTPSATPASPWTYTVSVRSLCEFSAKQGDLDRRFTPSATALEGQQGQLLVAQRRGADYESEVALQTVEGALRVRGRADGYDPRRRCLEEIKTLRGSPQDVPANRQQLHWAQLLTYGALFCRERGLSEIALALVYFDFATQTETELLEVFGADALHALFSARCAQFLDWAEQEARHRAARDLALTQLPFPLPAFRQGQRELSTAVYRAARDGRCLLAQAPTGIGKTVGTLFPLLRALPAQGIDKLAYLTCKGTGRETAMASLQMLRDGTPGRALRVLTLVPQDSACVHPDKACHGDDCPLAQGFYDRLPAARAQAVALGWLDAAAQRRVALAHGICPYYLGQELMRWADVLVGDVHHVFDPRGALWGLAQAQEWKLALLVDEAHNLVERARAMHSAELSLAQLRAARALAPAALHDAFDSLLQALQDASLEQATAYAVWPELPDALEQALERLGAALSEHFQSRPTAIGPLLNFHFELQRWLKLADSLGAHTLLDLQLADEGSATDSLTPEATLSLRNVVPASFLRPRFAALQSCTLFSATLGPRDYPVCLLGLPEDTAWIDVPPVFPAEHLQVQVARQVSTRYAHRAQSLPTLLSVLVRQFDAQPGNYLAFFSSFDYLQQAAAALAQQRPDIPQWRQDRAMGHEARLDFLQRFAPDGQGIGFAVLGGVFAEGVDLPGTRLIGAFVATLGLPPVSPVQAQFRLRLDAMFGSEHGYADLVPAMQKVVQAAGRVLRTPQDRGWLWLLDDRYLRPEVLRLLPRWWGLRPASAGSP